MVECVPSRTIKSVVRNSSINHIKIIKRKECVSYSVEKTINSF